MTQHLNIRPTDLKPEQTSLVRRFRDLGSKEERSSSIDVGFPHCLNKPGWEKCTLRDLGKKSKKGKSINLKLLKQKSRVPTHFQKQFPIFLQYLLNTKRKNFNTNISDKFNTFSRSWKPISQFNTLNTVWESRKRLLVARAIKILLKHTHRPSTRHQWWRTSSTDVMPWIASFRTLSMGSLQRFFMIVIDRLVAAMTPLHRATSSVCTAFLRTATFSSLHRFSRRVRRLFTGECGKKRLSQDLDDGRTRL